MSTARPHRTGTLVPLFAWLITLSCCFPQTAAQALVGSTGLEASLAVDIVPRFGLGNTKGVNDRMAVREAEATFYAPIDHLFDGTLSLAAHEEGGTYLFELHEAVISTNKLIPRSRIRAGQFFLGFGRLNRIHRHDWPFTSAPLVTERFFGDHGIVDTGLEYGWLLPSSHYLDLTVGITSGWTFGHAHTEGTKPSVPTHYARLATYAPLFSKGETEFALNYVGRRQSAEESRWYLGLDAVAKWRTGRRLDFLVQTETWYRHLNGGTSQDLGTYIYPQYGFTESFYIGLRGDILTQLNRKRLGAGRISNYEYRIGPNITYRPSEFATLRAGYQLGESIEDGRNLEAVNIVEFQAAFILGSHPAHTF